MIELIARAALAGIIALVALVNDGGPPQHGTPGVPQQ
jgi:hypothetical protein